MASVEQLITENLDVWSSAVKAKSTQGRGSSKKIDLYGIKKLRSLILELAVRGLLVAQDANDEPASVLLERISEEKEQLVKSKKIKKTAVLPEITEEEKPFMIPHGWAFVRLGDLTSRLGSGSTPRGGKSAYVDSGIPFLRSQNVWNDGLKLDDTAYIPAETHEKMANTHVFPGDVLLNITGASLGRSVIFPQELETANVSQHVTIIRLIEASMAPFVHLGILSPMVQKLVWGRQVGMAIEGLSKKVLEQFEFPVPPLEEQYRIVTKVNELMALCDQLEQQQENSISAHQTLVEALLNTLVTAAGTPTRSSREGADKTESAFDSAWARIAEHFDTLFTTEHSIDKLKQTLLQLAVMGKLVPQNPNDEPASVLLEKIAIEKAQLIQDNKIKKQKELLPISEAEKPFELPAGWEWVRLGDLALMSDAGWSPKCPGHAREGDNWGVLKVSAVTWGKFKAEENKELPDKLEPREQYEVKSGDFLISRANTAALVARAVVVPEGAPEKLMMSDKIIRFIFAKGVNSNFINLFNNSSFSRHYYAEVAGGTSSSMKNVSRAQIQNLLIAMPPNKESVRITEALKSFSLLCDALREQLGDLGGIKLKLADVMADQAVN